jgi:predicted nucleotidyltransferase
MPEALHAHADGLQACIQAFDEVLPVERVLLFGSYSRGENAPESDVDLCIVTNGIETQQSTARTLRRAIGRIRNKPALNQVPISLERLAEKRHIRDPFFETILREGVCLAEKD